MAQEGTLGVVVVVVVVVDVDVVILSDVGLPDRLIGEEDEMVSVPDGFVGEDDGLLGVPDGVVGLNVVGGGGGVGTQRLEQRKVKGGHIL